MCSIAGKLSTAKLSAISTDKPAVGDPLQQALIAAVENGATVVRKLVIDPAVVAQQQIGVAGMEADQIAGLDLDLVPLDHPHERVVADDGTRSSPSRLRSIITPRP